MTIQLPRGIETQRRQQADRFVLKIMDGSSERYGESSPTIETATDALEAWARANRVKEVRLYDRAHRGAVPGITNSLAVTVDGGGYASERFDRPELLVATLVIGAGPVAKAKRREWRIAPEAWAAAPRNTFAPTAGRWIRDQRQHAPAEND